MQRRVNHLERDAAIGAEVRRQIHRAHPAASELLLDAILSVDDVCDEVVGH